MHDRDPHADSDPDADSDPHADGDSDGDAHADRDADPDADADPHTDADAEPAEMPNSTVMQAVLNGWTGAGTQTVADVSPQIGEAVTGRTSAYIDAPRIKEPVAALSADVPVTAGEEYVVTAQVRQGTHSPHEVAASITVGDTFSGAEYSRQTFMCGALPCALRSSRVSQRSTTTNRLGSLMLV